MADEPTKFKPLRDDEQMAQLIAEVTGQDIAVVRSKLSAEQKDPGSNVRRDFDERVVKQGGERYVYGPDMERFYSETDAFMYELAIWNRHQVKRSMARWIYTWIATHPIRDDGQPVELLSIGDGLGFDSREFAAKGSNVTYFEVPGLTASFAQKLFERSGDTITFLTDPDAIPKEKFDVLVCLDVLEHVPDPAEFVKMLAGYLKPGGVLFVHAPYYMIHPNYPTHVKASRRHSGSLKLYKDAGFTLLDGTPLWNPLVLQKAGGTPIKPSAAGKFIVRSSQPLLMLGRFWAAPFGAIHVGKKMLA